MIKIGAIKCVEKDKVARIESTLKITGEDDFLLFLEVDKAYGKYLVTERADAFLIGVLMYALVNGHDIECENPVTSSLLFMIEKHLIPILTKYESRFHHVKIDCATLEQPVPNEGAVGTGISLGVDSFYTIAEAYDTKSVAMKLTHLCVFNNGTFGGWFHNNNWDYCARKLHEKIENTAKELALPLLNINSNMGSFMRLRLDWYAAYFIMFNILSLGKLFGTYFLSSSGADYKEGFKLDNTYKKDCATYEVLLLGFVSAMRGVQFISGGGSKSRGEKLLRISEFPIGRKNLVSCLTEHYNCMECGKCKRNLIFMDAYGLLDAYVEAFDVEYYRKNREKYLRWMCTEIHNGFHGVMLRDAYEIIKQREPGLIGRIEKSDIELRKECDEMYRQRNVYREYTRLFRGALMNEKFYQDLQNFFRDNGLYDIVVYGREQDVGFGLLEKLSEKKTINIRCVVENKKPKQGYKFQHIEENTIDYPACDAIIVTGIAKAESVRKKLSYIVGVPIITLDEMIKAAV